MTVLAPMDVKSQSYRRKQPGAHLQITHPAERTFIGTYASRHLVGVDFQIPIQEIWSVYERVSCCYCTSWQP